MAMKTNNLMARNSSGQFTGLSERALRVQAGYEVRVDARTDARLRLLAEKEMQKASYTSIQHAAASIRKSAMASVVTAKTASTPGSPPRTRKGAARRAILYRADKWSGIVGFAYSKIGPAMAAHEHGTSRGKQKYPKRPTMLPAMERNLDRFARSFQGSLVGPGS